MQAMFNFSIYRQCDYIQHLANGGIIYGRILFVTDLRSGLQSHDRILCDHRAK